MDTVDKLNLIKNSPTEEIVTESELLDLRVNVRCKSSDMENIMDWANLRHK